MAHRVETERLRRNVGTLRRVAALAPLLGVLGTLFALGRTLERIPAALPPGGGGASLVAPAQPGVAWGPALAAALTPLTTGIALATLALVAYDGVRTRVEKLAGALDRLGAETIEAIALSAPPAATPIAVVRTPHVSMLHNQEGSIPLNVLAGPGSAPDAGSHPSLVIGR
jgi:biopolymer transport protein ExbB